MQVLREIWTVADSGKSNSLGKPEFFVAVRLIQLFQNNVKGEGTNLQVSAGVSLNAPYFEGFAAPVPAVPASAPVPAMVASSNPSSNSYALTTDPYAISPSDEAAFKQLFPSYADASTKKVPGNIAVQLFSKSGVDTGLLRNIWTLSDVDKDSLLSEKEFCVAMHLIVCVSKKGLPLPGSLPGSLAAFLHDGASVSAPASIPQPQQDVPPIQIPSPQQQQQNQQYLLPSPTSMPPSYTQQHQPQVQQQAYQFSNPPTLQQPAQQLDDKFSAFDDIDNSTIQSHYSVSNTPKETFQSMPVVHEPMNLSGAPSMPAVRNFGGETLVHAPPVATVSYTAPAPVTVSIHEPEISARSMSPTPVTSNAKVVSTSEDGDSQLRSLITELQAENVSLKAKLSMYSDEETSIAKEKNKLLTDLTVLIERVDALRKQCAEKREYIASGKAEIKGLQEKTEVLQQTITVEEAQYEWLENVNISKPEPESMDLFGSDPLPPPPPASVPVAFDDPSTSKIDQVPEPAVNPFAPAPVAPELMVSSFTPPSVVLPPPEPTPEEKERLNHLREATTQIGGRRDETEAKLKELKERYDIAETSAKRAEEEVNEMMNSKSKGFGGKKKKAKELESLESKAALERQKAYEAAHAVKLSEEAFRTLEAELELAQVELASFESIVQGNLHERKASYESLLRK